MGRGGHTTLGCNIKVKLVLNFEPSVDAVAPPVCVSGTRVNPYDFGERMSPRSPQSRFALRPFGGVIVCTDWRDSRFPFAREPQDRTMSEPQDPANENPESGDALPCKRP